MIRFATIGTSSITESFLSVLGKRPDAVFAGTLSRDAERAAAFTEAHGGSRPFTSLDALAADADIDAVYVGSPNGLHAAQALRLIEGGKHVLVEKSFAANEREAREVFDTAERANVVALEAMRPLHDPAFHALRDALPELGRIRRATLRFGKYSSRYDEILAGRHTNIFDCGLASGALMDMGVYTVEPMVALFGSPESIAFAPVLLDESARKLCGGALDGAGTILASYPGMTASLHYSKITSDLSASQIEGELGTLTVDAISTPSSARVELRCTPKQGDTVGYSSTETAGYDLALPHCANTMAYELADFIQAIEHAREGASALDAQAGPYGTVRHFRDITLASLRLMDEARRQAGIVFPADR